MAAAVKYLVGAFDESLLVRLYEHIADETSALGAIALETADEPGWWGDFIRAYAQGELYDLSAIYLMNNDSGRHDFIDEDDDTWSSTLDYRDLSGKVFVFDVQDPLLPPNSSLALTATGDFTDLHVFERQAGTLVHLGSDPTRVVIDQVEDYDLGEHLVAIVANGRAIPDYTGTTPLTLAADLTRGTGELLAAEVTFCFEFTWERDEKTSSGGYCDVDNLFGEGALTGTSFSYTIDHSPEHTGADYVGSISGTISEDRSLMTSLSVSLQAIVPGTQEVQFETAITAVNVPLIIETETVLWYRAEGDAACAVTTDARHDTYTSGFITTGFGCRTSDYVSIKLLTELPE